ncbi:alpha/beta fold hydrolase [Nocardia sp. NPDC127526]|uniref:alpha/beta fold hydrolase n=1 Tax=Nocardia sp. NPDC127526 TaxID=3345393 RepID=UPI0036280010
MTSTAPVSTATLTVPDGVLYYELRGRGPLLALIGSPMNAVPYVPVAELLAADFTVLTTDPRGHNRSILHDPETDASAEARADDVARLLAHVDRGPAAVFGSSGGAVTGLALAQANPGLVHTLIAHEPPLRELLDERAELRAAAEEMKAIARTGDFAGAYKKFFAMAKVPIPAEAIDQMFGGEREPREIASDRYFFDHEYDFTVNWTPDADALRQGATRLVIGIGDTSAGQFCDHTSRALGTLLDIEPVLFPGGHTGFMEHPDAFAKRLRDVLQIGDEV